MAIAQPVSCPRKGHNLPWPMCARRGFGFRNPARVRFFDNSGTRGTVAFPPLRLVGVIGTVSAMEVQLRQTTWQPRATLPKAPPARSIENADSRTHPPSARYTTLDFDGGQGGIRTRETLLTFTHFPGVRLQPLGHLSAEGSRFAGLPQNSVRGEGFIASV